MRKKVTVVGAGNVGATAAQRIFERGYADVALVDVVEGLPQGKTLDILQSGPIVGSDASIVGSNSYEETADSDIVVITAGIARKPGMSRDDLLLTNMKIVKDVTLNVVRHSPDCILIIVSNPLDAMAQLALEISQFPRNRVIGMSGILDTARFRSFIAEILGVSVEDVSACIMGGHGDSMVAIPRLSTVGGTPITELLPPSAIAQVVDRAVKGGAEIVSLLKTGSAYYAPSAAVAQMVDSIVLDQKRILPCAVYLKGEYEIHDLFVGVPIRLGASGMEDICVLSLTPEELTALQKSAAAVKELVEVMRLKGGLRGMPS